MSQEKFRKSLFPINEHRINDRLTIASVFLFNLLVAAVCILFFVPRALNNDDWIIHGITSGAYGEYSAITAHTNIILSSFLMLLQKHLPGINWFAVVEMILCWFAFSLAGAAVISRNRNPAGVSLAVIIGLFAAPDFYINIHNTKLTPVLAAAGLSALIIGVLNHRPFFILSGWIIALFSSFIRFNAFLIGALFAAGTGIAILLERNAVRENKTLRIDKRKKDIYISPIEPRIMEWWTKNRRLIIFVLLFFASSVFFAAVDHILIYKLPGGLEYREYNEARGMVSDFDLPGYDEFSRESVSMGISENDYQMLRDGNFADFEKFDKSALSDIAESGKQIVSSHPLSIFANQLVKSFSDIYFIIAVLTALLCLFEGGRKSLVPIAWIGIAYLVCILYFSLIGRVTHWVMSGVTGSFFIAAVMSTESGNGRKSSIKYIPAVALCSTAIIISIFRYAPYRGEYKTEFNKAAGEIFLELGERSDNLYLIDMATGPMNEIHRVIPTFSSTPKDFYTNSYILGGWDTASPAKNSILKRYNITYSPYRALIETDNVFLIDVKNYNQKLTYIRENYDTGTTMSLVDVISGYYVFGFSPGSESFSGVKPCIGLSVEETAVSADEVIGDFIYIGVKINGKVDDFISVYLRITGKNDNADVRFYRARVIETESGYAVMTSVKFTDILIPEDYLVSVVFKAQEGFIASDEAELFVRQ